MEGWKLPGNNLTNLTHFCRFSFEYLPKVFLIDFFLLISSFSWKYFCSPLVKFLFFFICRPGRCLRDRTPIRPTGIIVYFPSSHPCRLIKRENLWVSNPALKTRGWLLTTPSWMFSSVLPMIFRISFLVIRFLDLSDRSRVSP